jgi:hypothetical protein
MRDAAVVEQLAHRGVHERDAGPAVRPRGKRLGIAGRDADVAGSPYVSSPEGRNNLTEEVPSAELTHKVAGTLPPAGEDYLVTSMW